MLDLNCKFEGQCLSAVLPACLQWSVCILYMRSINNKEGIVSDDGRLLKHIPHGVREPGGPQARRQATEGAQEPVL